MEEDKIDIEFRTTTIFHTQQDEPWCNYILRHFQAEKLNLRVETLNISNLSMTPPPEMEMALKESYVIILLTTAHLMDYMEEHADWFPQVLRKRDPEVTTIISALLHLEDTEFQGVCNDKDYDQKTWEAVEIDITGKNMKACISLILGNVDRNSAKMANRKRSAVAKKTPLPKPPSESSIMPFNPVEMIPSVVRGAGERVALIFPSEMTGTITVQFKGMQKEETADRLNPYCFVFTTPELTNERTCIDINKDGEKYSRLRLTKRVAVVEFSGLDLMCQSYGVNSKEELDKKLAEKFNSSLCSDGQALRIFDEIMGITSTSSTARQDTLYPTMLHWAAANGLKDLSSALLSATGAHLACSITGSDGSDPADLAKNNGHRELAELLLDFMETRELAVACEDYVTCIRNQDDGGLYEEISPLGALPPPLPPRGRSGSERGASDDGSFSQNVPSKSYPPPDLFFHQPIEPVVTPGAIGSRSQKELIDIQHEVRKGNFSIKEAEMLFSAWKARYETGNAISFKERKNTLQVLREQHKKAVNLLKDVDSKSKKKKRGKSIGKESDTCRSIEVSEPFQPRRPFGSVKLPMPTGGSGRGSNTSEGTVSSWRSSHDSGRDSSVSQQSFSEDAEHESDNSVNLRRSNRFQSDTALDRTPDERRSTKELYLQLVDEDLPAGLPPPLPPRHTKEPQDPASPRECSPGPAIKSVVYSKKATPPTVPKKPEKSSFKFPKLP